MIISSSIHVAANGIILFFFMAEYYSIVYVYHIFFIHSSVDGHLGCFHVLAIVNSAAVNIGVRVSFWVIVLSGYMPKTTHIYYLIVLEVRNLEWVSLVWNQGVGRAVFPSEVLGENLFPCLFQLLELHSFVHGPVLHLQSYQGNIFKSLSPSFPLLCHHVCILI